MVGYPTKRTLYTWIENEGVQKLPRKALDNTNTVAHPRNPPIEVKMDAIHHCFELGEGIKCVSEEDRLLLGKHLCLAEKISPRRHCRADKRQKHKTRRPYGEHTEFSGY